MLIRSWMFVPGDSERKLEKALESEADALILDLEDAVADQRQEVAREMVRNYLVKRSERSGQQLWCGSIRSTTRWRFLIWPR